MLEITNTTLSQLSDNDKSLDASCTGDVVFYKFNVPKDCDDYSIYYWDYFQYRPCLFSEFTDTEILNTEVISELEKNHKVSSQLTTKSSEAFAVRLRALKESINRIKRYNNKGNYEGRLGFVSTLSVKAEEIGINNTVNFLVRAIDKHIVFLMCKIVQR